MATPDIIVRILANLDDLKKGVGEATETIEHLGGPVGGLIKSFQELAEAVAVAFAIEKIAEFVNEIVTAAQRVGNLGQVLGMTTDAVQELQYAAKALGGNSDALTGAMEHFNTTLSRAEGGMKRAQVAYRALGIEQQFLKTHSPAEILDEIREKFEQSANGAHKNAVAMALFGGSLEQVIPWLNMSKEKLEEIAAAEVRTGEAMNFDLIEKFSVLKSNVVEMKGSFEGLGNTLLAAFLPALQSIVRGLADFVESLNRAFKEVGPLHDALTGLVLAFDILVTAVAVASAIIQEAWQITAAIVELHCKGIEIALRVVWDAMHFDWSKIKTDWQAGINDAAEIVERRMKNMATVAAEVAAAIKGIFANINAGGVAGEQYGPPPPPKGGTGKIGAMVPIGGGSHHKEKDDSDKIALDDLNTQLEINKMRLEAIKSELADEVTLGRITANEKYQIEKDLTNQLYQLDQQEITNEMANLEKGTLAYEKMANKKLKLAEKNALDIQKISHQQLMAQTREYEAFGEKISGVMGTFASDMLTSQTTWQKESLKALDTLTNDFIKDVEKMVGKWIIHELQKTTATATQSGERSIIDTSEGGSLLMVMGKSLYNWLFGETTKTAATTAGVATRKGVELAGSAATVATKATETAITTGVEAAKTGAVVTGVAVRTAAETTGAATGIGLTISTGLKDIVVSAYRAAAGAYAALASIPYVGPFIAPAAAAAALAAVLHFAGAFETGSWNIGSTGLAQIHQGEMIIPATQANKIRSSVAASGGKEGDFESLMFTQPQMSRGAAGTMGGHNYNINISAIDSQSVSRFFNDAGNQRLIVNALSKQHRNGNTGGFNFG